MLMFLQQLFAAQSAASIAITVVCGLAIAGVIFSVAYPRIQRRRRRKWDRKL